MKSLSPNLHHEQKIRDLAFPVQIPDMSTSVREILALLSAVTVATGFILLSVWLSALGAAAVASAALWGMALVFFGLALDSPKPKAALQLLTGVALVTLAWLQHAVSAEFLIVSGALIAAWAVVAIFDRLK